MSNRIHATLVISLCMTSSLLLACDAPDDDDLVEDLGEDLDALDELAAAPRATAGQTSPSERLTKDWVRWVLGLPQTPGPISDPTGAQCGLGQDGNVWFLAGTFGGPATRECTIPQGKQLYFPLVNWFGFRHEVDEEEIAATVAWVDSVFERTCGLTLRIDGEDVVAGDLDDMLEEQWVEVYEPFDGMVDGNWLGSGNPGGLYHMLTAGYYARIQPLPPGDHVLELGGRICDGEQTWFETSVTYNLHIGG